jgi:hypothetical protein
LFGARQQRTTISRALTVISPVGHPVQVSIEYFQTNQVPNHQLRLLKSF